jgi:hypothetical protein
LNLFIFCNSEKFHAEKKHTTKEGRLHGADNNKLLENFLREERWCGWLQFIRDFFE